MHLRQKIELIKHNIDIKRRVIEGLLSFRVPYFLYIYCENENMAYL